MQQVWYQFQRLMSFMVYRFFADDCMYRASALTFTSLLALVPLMAVSFAILAAFPVYSEFAEPIQNFIFTNFVPATGEVIQQYLIQFATQASRLSWVGVAALLMTSVMVMFTIERALNTIWRTPVRRKGVTTFLLYWGILSLTPLLMGAGFAVSSYVVSLAWVNGSTNEVSWLKTLLTGSTPFLLSWMTFALLFIAVPNCKVKLHHGLIGALVAALLFELAKWGFGFYWRQFNNYQLLYGAFASIPLFFLWVYWVWLMVLVGAELTHALSASYDRRRGKKVSGLVHALLWLRQLWHAQQSGRAMTLDELIAGDQVNYEQAPERQLKALFRAKLIQANDAGAFILSRDLSSLSLLELYRALPWKLPKVSEIADLKWAATQLLQQQLAANEQAQRQLLIRPLKDFFVDDPSSADSV
ncbi:MAG: YihY family inner membrane protein [Legionellales bacterium]|nr:YihY family inner membrane protein [Legionellales bacterium]